MREFVIQKAWERYQGDFGLGRIQVFVAAYNSFLFFSSILFFNTFDIYFLIPVVVAFLFFSIRKWYIHWKPHNKFFFLLIPMILAIGFNYFLIGRLDRIAGGLERLDEYFLLFEKNLFGSLLGLKIENFLHSLGLLGKIQFELMMISYFLFYLFPYFGAIRFFIGLKRKRKYIIGRFLASLTIYHSLNYLCYLLVPITGPQHYVPYLYEKDLNFLLIGDKLHALIHFGQNNYIDCFPSGHFGATLLVTLWMLRIKDDFRYLMVILTFLIAFATLTLRYHYLIDLLGAIPLCFLSYYLGKKLIPVVYQQSDYNSKSQLEN